MRRIMLEVPDSCEHCDMCDLVLHESESYRCAVFEEDLVDFEPCQQCKAVEIANHVLIHLEGGVPQVGKLIGTVQEAEDYIKTINSGIIPEDEDIAEQLRENSWGRIDLDDESEIYFIPFNFLTREKPE